QLRPLLTDLGSLAEQGTPVMTSLKEAAPALARQYTNLAPFAGAARSALIQLGASAAAQQPALVATIPLLHRLNNLGTAAVPTAQQLDRLLTSLDRTGAIEQLMALLFNGTTAANGFDPIGH